MLFLILCLTKYYSHQYFLFYSMLLLAIVLGSLQSRTSSTDMILVIITINEVVGDDVVPPYHTFKVNDFQKLMYESWQAVNGGEFSLVDYIAKTTTHNCSIISKSFNKCHK